MLTPTQQTRGFHPMLFQCWASVVDGGPTLKQHWVNASCLLGRAQIYKFTFSVICQLKLCHRDPQLQVTDNDVDL